MMGFAAGVGQGVEEADGAMLAPFEIVPRDPIIPQDDKRHGYGRCTYPDGRVFEGAWEGGSWVQTQAHPNKTQVECPPTLRAHPAGGTLELVITAYDEEGQRRLSGGDRVVARLEGAEDVVMQVEDKVRCWLPSPLPQNTSGEINRSGPQCLYRGLERAWQT